jgi:hypothetical protein
MLTIIDMRRIFLLAVLLFPIVSHCQVLAEYEGGRYKYSYVKLTLYKDSTYSYYEWMHTRMSRKDIGHWSREGNYLLLSSLEESYWKYLNKQTGKKSYLFRKDKFRLENDIVKLYQEEQEQKNAGFYPVYYTLAAQQL